MDRQQLIGLLLIFALIFVFSWYNRPDEAALGTTMTTDSLVVDDTTSGMGEPSATTEYPAGDQPVVRDSMVNLQQQLLYGDFYPAASGEEQFYTLENDRLRLRFSNKGGRIVEAWLKNYKRVEEGSRHEEIKLDLFLMNHPLSRFGYLLPSRNIKDGVLNTGELYFDAGSSENEIVFTATSATGAMFRQVYRLTDNPYVVDYRVETDKLDLFVDRNTTRIELNWTEYLNKLEKNDKFEKTYATLQYKLAGEGPDYCKYTGDDTDDLTGKQVEWISNSNQFFSSVLLPAEGTFLQGGLFSVEMAEDEASYLKETKTQVFLPIGAGGSQAFDMSLYIGPNKYDRLKSFGNGLEETINFGRSVFGTLNRWVIRPLFLFFLNLTNSAGMAILLLILLVKTALYPLTYKMLKSSAKMAALKPEITQIKEKHKDDNQTIQMKTMEMYRKFGVSPFGGCMPMILQMPIWFALFRFFPAAFEFRQRSFLWATDLSSYDALFHLPFDIPMFGGHLSLFALLWTISTLLYTYYNSQNMDMGNNPAMKYMQYFMPVVFIVFFNNYASGLTAYMFFSNLINVLQTILTKRFIFDDAKIRAELELKKDKPKKRNSFSQRLEEAMKQQQKSLEEKQKQQKKK